MKVKKDASLGTSAGLSNCIFTCKGLLGGSAGGQKGRTFVLAAQRRRDASGEGGDWRDGPWRGGSYRQSRKERERQREKTDRSVVSLFTEKGGPPRSAPPCPGSVLQLSVEVGVQVVLLAELVREGDAGEQLAPVALDGVDVEEHGEPREEPHKHQQEDDDLTALAVQVHAAEADVRQEGEGQEEAGDEAADVGEVVDPGQQAEGKEEEHHAQQLGEGPPGLGQDLPALEQLHEQAGQDPELGAGRPHLRQTQLALGAPHACEAWL